MKPKNELVNNIIIITIITKICRCKHEIVYTFFPVLVSQAININKNK